ncbi:MAG: class I SAM-dependent methyltransferase, partial [Saprospiraceae bacterium]|nr:class I SAM-dependent methyltransferase [Pyrinomonadaceae bacterium]
MSLKTILKKIVETSGYTIKRPSKEESYYDGDGLKSIHNHDFLRDPEFIAAYGRGVEAAGDLNWHWRVHVGLWTAYSAGRLDGDFVECGVNRGFLSSAIMHYLDWDQTGKTFYLLDTFAGMDERYVSEKEINAGTLYHNQANLESGHYVRGVDSVRANFSQWKNVRIIEGPIPETLSEIDTASIAYLHLDM